MSIFRTPTMPNEDRIHIIQCLCPSRHCIMALAYDPRERDPEAAMADMRNIVRAAINSHSIDPLCGICGSRDWFYEDGRSIFRTMEEAIPVLRRSGEAQVFTRRFFSPPKN